MGLIAVAAVLLFGGWLGASHTSLGAPDSGGPSHLSTFVYYPGGDSPTYLSSPSRDSFNPAETTLSPSNAASIKLLWAAPTNSTIYAQPAVVNGTLYLPTWGGYLDAFNATNGTLLYASFLGTQTACAGMGTAGMASSPTLVGTTLYVGGASGRWLAVDSRNGSILWNVTTGTPSKGFYNWGSPLVVGGEEYVGLSSSCDRPLVPGAVLAINTTTHLIDGRFNTTANGTRGASEWSSPTYDADLDQVIVTTGNPGLKQASVRFSESILAFSPTNLSPRGSWRVPANASIPDGDFGSTPTLVNVGSLHLAVAINKDGYIYAWNRTNVTAGPVWQVYVGWSQHDIASAAFDGDQVYVGAGSPYTVGGHTYGGSLWAVDPVNGTVNWTLPLNAPVQTAPYTANGLVAVESGARLYVVEASSGKVLRTLYDPTGHFLNAPLISHGILYAGSTDGHLYAYGLSGATSGGGGGHHHLPSLVSTHPEFAALRRR